MTKGLMLHLVLKHCYYDEIDQGKKKIEYRENTAYWRKRIVEKWNCNGGNIVIFHKGYTRTTMTFNVKMLVLGEKYISLHLGDRIHANK